MGSRTSQETANWVWQIIRIKTQNCLFSVSLIQQTSFNFSVLDYIQLQFQSITGRFYDIFVLMRSLGEFTTGPISQQSTLSTRTTLASSPTRCHLSERVWDEGLTGKAAWIKLWRICNAMAFISKMTSLVSLTCSSEVEWPYYITLLMGGGIKMIFFSF